VTFNGWIIFFCGIISIICGILIAYNLFNNPIDDNTPISGVMCAFAFGVGIAGIVASPQVDNDKQEEK
jgi:uncharacterized membrane protein HdeD (DUF308 family)